LLQNVRINQGDVKVVRGGTDTGKEVTMKVVVAVAAVKKMKSVRPLNSQKSLLKKKKKSVLRI
jgi:hypothetical protein